MRPFRGAELVVAACQDPEVGEIKACNDIDEEVLMELCCNLLTLDSQCGDWRFSHSSVAEYFEGHPCVGRLADRTAVLTCLIWLLNFDSKPQHFCFPQMDEINSMGGNREELFGTYVYGYWMLHVRQLEVMQDDRLGDLLQDFLGPPNRNGSLSFLKGDIWVRVGFSMSVATLANLLSLLFAPFPFLWLSGHVDFRFSNYNIWVPKRQYAIYVAFFWGDFSVQ